MKYFNFGVESELIYMSTFKGFALVLCCISLIVDKYTPQNYLTLKCEGK